MKRIFTKRLFPLLLALIMLMGAMSLTAFAADDEILLGAVAETNEEAYKYLTNTKAGLKAIAALKGYPGAGAVIDGAFGALFGTDTERVQEALAKINQKLDEIKAQMTDMTKYLDDKITISKLKDSIEKRITDYSDKSSAYRMRNETYKTRLEQLKEKPNETPAEKQSRLQATEDFYLYTVNKEWAGGDDYHEWVRMFGDIILKSDSTAFSMDLFTAFDKLVLYSYNWEHLGYKARINFQSEILNLYIQLSTTSMAGLIVGIDNAEKSAALLPEGSTERRKIENDKATMLVRLNLLKKQIADVLALADAHPINIRAADERYYQVPGHELLLKATAVPKTINPNFPNGPSGWIMSYDLFGGVLCDGIDKSLFKWYKNTGGYLPLPNDGISAPYPSPEWLVAVYKDYGGTKSLYDIFTEGGINIAGIMGKGAPFVTNQWWKVGIFEWMGGRSVLDREVYFMNLINNNGKPLENNDRWLADVKTYGGEIDGINKWEPQMMIGLIVVTEIKADAPSGDGIKASGMEESYAAPYSKDINLSVENKGDLYAYEWQVDKDGHGFMPIDGANTASYALGAVDDSMNGYQYRCLIINHVLEGEVKTVMTNSVTLNLLTDTAKENQKPKYENLILAASIIAVIIIAGLLIFVGIKKKRSQAVKM